MESFFIMKLQQPVSYSKKAENSKSRSDRSRKGHEHTNSVTLQANKQTRVLEEEKGQRLRQSTEEKYKNPMLKTKIDTPFFTIPSSLV